MAEHTSTSSVKTTIPATEITATTTLTTQLPTSHVKLLSTPSNVQSTNRDENVIKMKTTNGISWRSPMLPATKDMKYLSFESNFDHFDDGVMESRDDYIQIRPAASHVAHFGDSQFGQVQVSAIKKSNGRSDTGMYLATPLGIAVCSIALILIIAVGIIVLRKRVSSTGGGDDMPAPEAGPNPVSPSGATNRAKPLHMNGYENPTHKYLEKEAMMA